MPESVHPVRRVLALSWQEKWQLAALTLLLPIVDLHLRARGLQATRRSLGRLRGLASPRLPDALDMQRAERLAQLAAIAGKRGLYANTCLRQALLVHWWLRRRGLPAELVIGAQPGDANLDAHAWIELQGIPLAQHRQLPPELVRFSD
ncbi:lasso peptide biosynthesis B2 protein [Aerolutibacter daejeonensis]|uniref:lasso peptide biosynthesis B2 protein n=1 Tax=Aerolutibacter daejeonensis TaxID=346181 RepID=UPI00068E853F|nr:lasso peptide biosynthesis B2 protein [Lysobacter daejeonensis]